ncbi:MAG: hypothetical protein R3B06_25745 [Kofleriaceae bacterium]
MAVAVVAGLGGCADDAPSCGPGTAAADGITLTIDGEAVAFTGFTASVNNDCTVAGAGVISVSVHATQVGSAAPLTLCLPRPDLLGTTAVPLAPSRVPPLAEDRVQVIDASAALAGGCTAALTPAGLPVGTASFTGYCGGGTDPAGYALTVSGTVPVMVTCPAGTTTATGTLAGTAAVSYQ